MNILKTLKYTEKDYESTSGALLKRKDYFLGKKVLMEADVVAQQFKPSLKTPTYYIRVPI